MSHLVEIVVVSVVNDDTGVLVVIEAIASDLVVVIKELEVTLVILEENYTMGERSLLTPLH